MRVRLWVDNKVNRIARMTCQLSFFLNILYYFQINVACRLITILRTVTAGGSVPFYNIPKIDNFIFLIIAAETLAGARPERTVMDRTFWMKTEALQKVKVSFLLSMY